MSPLFLGSSLRASPYLPILPSRTQILLNHSALPRMSRRSHLQDQRHLGRFTRGAHRSRQGTYSIGRTDERRRRSHQRSFRSFQGALLFWPLHLRVHLHSVSLMYEFFAFYIHQTKYTLHTLYTSPLLLLTQETAQLESWAFVQRQKKSSSALNLTPFSTVESGTSNKLKGANANKRVWPGQQSPT